MLPLFLFMMMFFVTDVVVVAVVVVFVLKTFAINEMVYIRMLHQMPFHDSAFFLIMDQTYQQTAAMRLCSVYELN